MKILFVTMEHPCRLVGGMGTFVREFVRELRTRQGFQVEVVYFHSSDEEPPGPDETVDYVFRPIGAFDVSTSEGRSLEAATSLLAQTAPILSTFRPDVIHCNDRQTFLPFRFFANVVYSSHLLFSDMISTLGMDDIYFQELKVERCALTRSAAVVVYSKFAQTRAWKGITGKCSPVVLPLGFDPNHYGPGERGKEIRIAYFGRFESVQKGLNEFVRAVRLLGKRWAQERGVVFSLYGKGDLPAGTDLELFDEVTFLEGEELRLAFGRSSIVVMPSKYEPFGLVGLEAIASGCLLIAPSGLGMDEYAEAEVTFVPTESDAVQIAKTIQKVVADWDFYSELALRARLQIKQWTWQRCVDSHIRVYREIVRNGGRNLKLANRSEYSRLQSQIPRTPNTLDEWQLLENHIRGCAASCSHQVLLLHPFASASIPDLGSWVISQSLWDYYLGSGPCPRLECIPDSDKSWDEIWIVAGWETQFHPKDAIRELDRLMRKQVRVIWWNNDRLPWHSLVVSSPDDWTNLLNASEIKSVTLTVSQIENSKCWSESLISRE